MFFGPPPTGTSPNPKQTLNLINPKPYTLNPINPLRPGAHRAAAQSHGKDVYELGDLSKYLDTQAKKQALVTTTGLGWRVGIWRIGLGLRVEI